MTGVQTAPPPSVNPGGEGGDPPPGAVRLGGTRGGWFRQVGWRHLVGLLALAFALFPILFVVSAAFNPVGTLSSSTLVPTGASLANFTELFTETRFARWFGNTLLIGLLSAGLSVFLSACAAFAFSRFRFTGRRVGLLTALLVQLFPQFLNIVALYLVFVVVSEYYPALGFNTPWALILLTLGTALGVNTWLMKGFFDTVPRDLDESAKVDGATHAQVFFGIILPLVRPILAVTGLLAFIATVSEFIIASVFLTDDRSKTVAVGLYGLVASGIQRNDNFGVFAAGALITAIPTVLLFQYLQRYIVGGLTAGAVKG
ncbi:sugar ABC transporter permease [Geodermatophilus sp. DSM 44513]|uniref:sugar ABC transporter permease n=1 Tax=Geodermatophilus sp. DSM 44513 TaxID=1528104 RepID=UPI00128245DD|nr:sugar ABC transporter permease [Geodermatophilus sp. DSM 44513]WNV74554.1 sugar ABC transporter permease [Geodermatophilus sp. DSM 44513]